MIYHSQDYDDIHFANLLALTLRGSSRHSQASNVWTIMRLHIHTREWSREQEKKLLSGSSLCLILACVLYHPCRRQDPT
ncbi:hypothetical protein EUGRSUZ_C03700 [Eucalyptus grandis]|uniref:Uncharacterized protein n=2 Tax=Eucalyptus grandis TaxID=71139 RepID=A0ACC3LJL1_EUCGR|nr:hypothetical protein EUGRSUZ_C03700 [Eucalyptus grandis]